jgi:large subunit ribosomal protein L24
MAKTNVKKGDNVMVIAGKDKGKSGKILKVLRSENRVYVEGINIVSRSKKPRKAQEKGGILKQEGKIDISNVMPICPVCKAVVRVRRKEAEKGSVVKSVRICAKCGAPLDEKKSAAKKAVKKTAKKKETAAQKEQTAQPETQDSETSEKE